LNKHISDELFQNKNYLTEGFVTPIN